MNRNEFARNLVAGTYDLIVLDLLQVGPNYGYGIRKLICQRSHGTLDWQDGTLYPVLRHLEQQGLVTSVWKRPKTGRQRHYYRLTRTGRQAWRDRRRQWTLFTSSVEALLTP